MECMENLDHLANNGWENVSNLPAPWHGTTADGDRHQGPSFTIADLPFLTAWPVHNAQICYKTSVPLRPLARLVAV